MSGIKTDPTLFQNIQISPRDEELLVQMQEQNPELYRQAFSPEYPDAWSVNDHQFSQTTNANVRENDVLKGQYSPAPELPRNETDYSKILFFMVAGFLIYKFIKKGI